MENPDNPPRLIDGIHHQTKLEPKIEPESQPESVESPEKKPKWLLLSFSILLFLGLILTLGIIFNSQVSHAKKFFSYTAQKLLTKKIPEKNYLILFQNPAEIRATGGFIGNMGVLTLDGSHIKNLSIYDIYSLKYQYSKKGKELIYNADKPLSFLRKDMRVNESNWIVDFPATAQKIEKIFYQYGGPKIDGVIAIDIHVFEDLLASLGPIKMPDYQVNLTTNNFAETIKYKVEVDNPFQQGDHRQNPKQILTDFAPLLLSKIEKANFFQKVIIYQTLLKNLEEKHILIYAHSQPVEDYLISHNFAGAVKKTQEDYLQVVTSNISGTKTFTKIRQNLDLKIRIQPDGSVKHILKITHKNLSKGGLFEEFDRSYLQIIVPKGAKLVKFIDDRSQPNIKKIKTFSLLDKTVFGYDHLETFPSQSRSVLFEYLTPKNSISKNFSLDIQKQPGVEEHQLKIKITFPEYSQISSTNIQGAKITDRIIQAKLKFVKDFSIDVNLEN